MEAARPIPPTRGNSEPEADSEAFSAFRRLRRHLDQHIVGQPALTEKLLVCLLADGHLLVEGAPGLAKTKAIKTLASAIEGEDHRIQFTPDLLPADLTGTEIFQPEAGTFRFERGPLFHNLILA
ncbi:MAG TPA: AAA family ATPase, partial [Deltaproteobacteria bacterium]|nr:AAA family ATPase [Deltaproteobacteria bacterium]